MPLTLGSATWNAIGVERPRPVAPSEATIPAQPWRPDTTVVAPFSDRWEPSSYAQRIAGASGAVQANGVASASGDVSHPSCKTCEDRRYQDGSDDATVSFQSPTHISSGEAYGAVAGHEGEHVRNEQIRAQQEGREVVYQHVRIKTGICPECGKVYVAGGETVTATRASASRSSSAVGGLLDARA